MKAKDHPKIKTLMKKQRIGWSVMRLLKSIFVPVESIGMRLFYILDIKGYIKTLGFKKGLIHIANTLFSNQLKAVELPGYSHKIWVRYGTSDPFVFYSVFIFECYRRIKKHKGIETILDAGAYTGYSSLYFANAFPSAIIVAIEPHPKNFEILIRNTNHLENMHPIWGAIAPENGVITLETAQNYDESQFWGARVKPNSFNAQGSSVPAYHISKIESEAKISHWDAIKIDIEGGERNLFDDGHLDLSRSFITFIELHDHFDPGCSESFFNACDQFPAQLDTFEENVIVEPLPVETSKNRSA